MSIEGNIVDVINSDIYPGIIEIRDGRIIKIRRTSSDYSHYIIPPFVDAHVHIESSMLVPSEFARVAVRHGTVATVSDPHEIANVLGISGVRFMLDNGKTVPFKFYFGAPSCVPATEHETSGGRIGAEEIEELFKTTEVNHLSEVMNFPGVINNDPDITGKIEIARRYGKPIDGHAPGLRGDALRKYISSGISTDHECLSLEEAEEKIQSGMKILIRQGSAAKDLMMLLELIDRYPDNCMFCTDDCHPDDLVKGPVREIVKNAIASGIDKFKVLRCVSVNPVKHYGLDVGLLQEGDYADLLIIDNFKDFNILKTVINGKIVSDGGRTLVEQIPVSPVNNFNIVEKRLSDFTVKKSGEKINLIIAEDKKIVTGRERVIPKVSDDYLTSDPERDILKIVVINRYHDAPAAVAFVKGFGLKKGAIASSVAHDSHNIIAVGVSDRDLLRAVNNIISNRGGMAVASDEYEECIPLPVAGLMATDDGFEVAERYHRIDSLAKALGASLSAPFMTLSFMALPVIPSLKLTDRGLFDSVNFRFISLFETG
ncbi:MAG: adenine deaminase [Nitrospirae bacterium]|nr:adenine deaminase [Nitrospirota bacterium]